MSRRGPEPLTLLFLSEISAAPPDLSLSPLCQRCSPPSLTSLVSHFLCSAPPLETHPRLPLFSCLVCQLCCLCGWSLYKYILIYVAQLLAPSHLCSECIPQQARTLAGRRRRSWAGPPTGRPPRRRASEAEVGAPAGRRIPRTLPAPLALEIWEQSRGKRREH